MDKNLPCNPGYAGLILVGELRCHAMGQPSRHAATNERLWHSYRVHALRQRPSTDEINTIKMEAHTRTCANAHTEKEHQGLFSKIWMGFLVTVFYWFWYFPNSPRWTHLEQLFISWLYSYAVCYNYFWKDPQSFRCHLFLFPVTRCRRGEPLSNPSQSHGASLALTLT